MMKYTGNPKLLIKETQETFDTVIIDFLNVYMRYLQGDYDQMNENTFLKFIDIIADFFRGKNIFFVKKIIWELPEEFQKKALKRNKKSSIFFVNVINENDEIKYKERDDFVCYSLLNSIPRSIVISNDLKILDQKNIGNTGINIDILTLSSIPIDIQKSMLKNCSYSTPGDYSKVLSFRFNRASSKKTEKK